MVIVTTSLMAMVTIQTEAFVIGSVKQNAFRLLFSLRELIAWANEHFRS